MIVILICQEWISDDFLHFGYFAKTIPWKSWRIKKFFAYSIFIAVTLQTHKVRVVCALYSPSVSIWKEKRIVGIVKHNKTCQVKRKVFEASREEFEVSSVLYFLKNNVMLYSKILSFVCVLKFFDIFNRTLWWFPFIGPKGFDQKSSLDNQTQSKREELAMNTKKGRRKRLQAVNPFSRQDGICRLSRKTVKELTWEWLGNEEMRQQRLQR